jgi:hypothetical protein
VHEYTGLPINHVVVVNFHSFSKLIDKLGGVDINVPEAILSNKFDCPYSTNTRCERWKGWRFRKGVQHMNGYRALIYSRVRENQLNPPTLTSREPPDSRPSCRRCCRSSPARALSSSSRSSVAT